MVGVGHNYQLSFLKKRSQYRPQKCLDQQRVFMQLVLTSMTMKSIDLETNNGRWCIWKEYSAVVDSRKSSDQPDRCADR